MPVLGHSLRGLFGAGVIFLMFSTPLGSEYEPEDIGPVERKSKIEGSQRAHYRRHNHVLGGREDIWQRIDAH